MAAAIRRLGNLRSQLVRWLLIPLTLLVAVDAVSVYYNALEVADLAYDRYALVELAKLGVLAASTVAAVVGSVLLVSAARSPSAAPSRGRGS